MGATAHERAAALPGDDLVEDAKDPTTRALTIHAKPADVWPWLVQIGQDRGGFYTYAWLENLFGLHIANAEAVVARWQRLGVGDSVRLVPQGWMGGAGFVLPVVMVLPGRAIVLRMTPAASPWDAIWTFVLEPVDGAWTRLVSRSRSGSGSWWMRPAGCLMEPVIFLMERGMVRGIKARAERAGGSPPADVPA